MTQASFLPSPPRVHRLLLACLLAIPLSSACGDDEPVTPPPDLTLSISALDGLPTDTTEPLRCDGLLVQLEITPPRAFTLRPPNACGTSPRCGYVRFEALDADGDVLASVDTVTTVGLLEPPPEALERLSQIRATLLRGTDQEPVQNTDASEVSTSVGVKRPPPAACDAPPSGGAGAGGAPSNAGAGGAPTGAGAGGVPTSAGAGGQAGAESGGAPGGGAENGGAPGGGAESGGAGAGGALTEAAGTSGA